MTYYLSWTDLILLIALAVVLRVLIREWIG